MSLTDIIYANTLSYLTSVSKAKRKTIGQFFTPAPIADFMANLSKYRNNTVWVLDPGAGSGVLSASIVDALISKAVKHIHLDVYENNSDILPLLKDNLSYIQSTARKSAIEVSYTVFETNFIEAYQLVWTGLMPNEKYDIVIANPPYKKIGKNDMESNIMKDIVHGQPNLYFLFMAMSAKLLRQDGECIFIVPRSFSSGLYFTAFRNYFLNSIKITNIHLFTSREAVGGVKDNVLQETIILRAKKSDSCPKTIEITESCDENCYTSNHFNVGYDKCVKRDDNAFLFLPTSEEDAQILDFINQWPSSLPELGFKMKTGIVVDFRETEWMRDDANEDVIPLLWAYNFSEYRVRFPVTIAGKPQYLCNDVETDRLKMKKGNYLLLKRFTSKEESKRLQCALLFEEDFLSYDAISTENHLNFITRTNGIMTKEELYGLFVVLNSDYLDRYFRILNGSTQVNANEINSMPFPALHDIVQIGRKAMCYQSLSEIECNAILESIFLPMTICKAM